MRQIGNLGVRGLKILLAGSRPAGIAVIQHGSGGSAGGALTSVARAKDAVAINSEPSGTQTHTIVERTGKNAHFVTKSAK